MCGIAGVVGLDGSLHPAMHAAVRNMSSALVHRGPDGAGFFDSTRAVLGHRRLAIIDRAGGQQPITNEDESCWIVFNGEIYNHRELRALLLTKGHQFRTNADTEVILHAYEEYGPSCVERLEGMFAFAIYDARKSELFAARDRVGEKPFFYAIFDEQFHFASELPALRHSPLWKGDIDVPGLESYLSLGYFVAPSTIYRDVHKLPPACWMRVANGQVRVQQYWDVVEFDTDRRETPALVDAIDESLRRAVQDRLESEVPLGAFLSGGIDSGLVVSYMAEADTNTLVTTTVGFSESEHNELAAADLVATHFGSEHHPEVIRTQLDKVIGPVTDYLGEPLADASLIPTWYLSSAARRHVTVALSGDGGDESFAGYDFRYLPHAMERRVRRWMPPGTPALAGWLGARWPRSRRLPKALRLRTLLENLDRDAPTAYYADLAFMKSAETRTLIGLAPQKTDYDGATYAAVTDAYRRCPSKYPVQCAQYADLKVYMPNDPLVKVDRMSMAHGLEVRCPFLDHRVIELAFRIPATKKQDAWRGKALLRELARRRLPSTIWKLPKKGFTAPMSESIAGRHSHMFESEVLGTRSEISSYVDRGELARRFNEHRKGTADHSYVLWATWVLERFLKKHADARVHVEPLAAASPQPTVGRQ